MKSFLAIAAVLALGVATPAFASEVTGTLTAGANPGLTGTVVSSSGTSTLTGTVTPGSSLTGTVVGGGNTSGSSGSSGSGGGSGGSSSGGTGGTGGGAGEPELIFAPNVGAPNTGGATSLPMNLAALLTALAIGFAGYRLYRRDFLQLS